MRGIDFATASVVKYSKKVDLSELTKYKASLLCLKLLVFMTGIITDEIDRLSNRIIVDETAVYYYLRAESCKEYLLHGILKYAGGLPMRLLHFSVARIPVPGSALTLLVASYW